MSPLKPNEVNKEQNNQIAPKKKPCVGCTGCSGDCGCTIHHKVNKENK